VESNGNDLSAVLIDVLKKKKIETLLYPKGTTLDACISEIRSQSRIEPVPWQDSESFKDSLWNVDAGITSALAGIASTGSLLLCGSSLEPRAISLVPPIHIAILSTAKIYSTFEHALSAVFPPLHDPRNFVLISGPSKTADIEGSLVHGIHGPKELIVILTSGKEVAGCKGPAAINEE